MDAVAEKKWYVAFVKAWQEKRVAAALQEMGEEYFLPVQHVRKQWSDRVKWVDQLVLRGMVFIHTTPKRRIPLMQQIYGIYSYMTDGGAYHPVEIPEPEMKTFMRMVNQSEKPVAVVKDPLQKGDKVVVTRGPLVGLEGELVLLKNKHCVMVRFGLLGAAVVEVALDSVQRAQKGKTESHEGPAGKPESHGKNRGKSESHGKNSGKPESPSKS